MTKKYRVLKVYRPLAMFGYNDRVDPWLICDYLNILTMEFDPSEDVRSLMGEDFCMCVTAEVIDEDNVDILERATDGCW